MNIALVLWLLCVGVSGGMFVLLLLGLLDGAFPAAADRNRWIEINNQVLNALFTLMSLYQHPALCHHLFLLCRWRPADAAELRADYCKDGAAAAPRPGDRAHIAVVVVLLHVTMVSQYVLCGLYWGYTRTTRPELAEDGFFVLGIVVPVAAAVYSVCSPLGKGDRCHELAACSVPASPATKSTQPTTPIGHVVVEPEWAGGMFDCGAGGEAAAATGCLVRVLRVRVEHGEAGVRERVRARRHVRAPLLRAALGVRRLGAAHPQRRHRRRRGSRRRAALRGRPALRRVLEDPDAETVRAPGQHGVLRL
jgi:hypothetical protein